MPCIQCSDGHWECGEDPRELCQNFRLYSMSAPDAPEAAPKMSPAGGPQGVSTGAGGWTKLGEFVAAFEVHYRIGFDGKPVVRIEPKMQRQQRPRPVNSEPLGSGSKDV
jgi:hypothetical protein